jgi:hypothetical protein
MRRELGSFEQIAAELKRLSATLVEQDASKLSSASSKRLRETINAAYRDLRRAIENLDPIKHPGFIFDPSNPNVVARLVGITMVAQPRKPLRAVERFYGSGVYALYYTGPFPSYAAISGKEHPIYVGKADPADPSGKTAIEQGDRLANRLNDHRKNIGKASSTLRVEDFEYRALVVQTGWQASAEGYLIHLFKPIWNSEMSLCYGFGKHGDAPTTRANLRSPWDTLHPGREWAHRDPDMKDAREARAISDAILRHLAEYPPFESVDQILRVFLEEIRDVS